MPGHEVVDVPAADHDVAERPGAVADQVGDGAGAAERGQEGDEHVEHRVLAGRAGLIALSRRLQRGSDAR